MRPEAPVGAAEERGGWHRSAIRILSARARSLERDARLGRVHDNL